jgi:hypothetical protein
MDTDLNKISPAIKHVLLMALDALDTSAKAVRPTAGGTVDGTKWTDLYDHAGGKTVLSFFELTLDKSKDLGKIDAGAKKLRKARCLSLVLLFSFVPLVEIIQYIIVCASRLRRPLSTTDGLVGLWLRY